MFVSYETVIISYETADFSYEMTIISYELAPVSYETKDSSYEFASVSCEQEMHSHDIARPSREIGEITCGKKAILKYMFEVKSQPTRRKRIGRCRAEVSSRVCKECRD